MLARVRGLFRKLPPSTDRWTCIWFLTIAWTGLAAGVVGFVERDTGSLIGGGVGLVILGIVLGMRRRADFKESCHQLINEDRE